MATVRAHAHIRRPTAEVWNVISDAGALADWFPGIDESTATESTRSCLMGGVRLEEEIITCDHQLNRFQYRIVSGMPVDTHLATIDVISTDPAGCIVIYSTDVTPDSLAEMIGPALGGAVEGLRAACEGTA